MTKEHLSILGQKLKYYRKLHGLTQTELAELIGVKQLQVCAIECGRKGIHLGRLILICQRFGIGLSDIMPLDNKNDDELKAQNIDEIQNITSEISIDNLNVLRAVAYSLTK